MQRGFLMRGVHRVVFDNGLVLLTEKVPRAKKAVMMAGIKVGSAYEDERLHGASHFNEHMLFKSNQYRNAQQIAEDLESDGTTANAFTVQTASVFLAKALPLKLARVVDIAFEAVTNLRYDPEEFSREQKVIMTEIRGDINNPMQYGFSNLFIPALFRGTPLERTVAGTEQSVGQILPDELCKFKRDFYVPNNMVIVVTGNFNQEELERKISLTFGTMPNQAIPPLDLRVFLDNQRIEKFEPHPSMKDIFLVLGYRVPGFDHPDAWKLKFLNGILSLGLSSRLFRELREKQGIGYHLGSAYESFGNGGIFAIYAGFEPKNFQKAREIIARELNDLKINLISDKEQQRVLNLLTSIIYDSLEGLMHRAEAILDKEWGNLPYDFKKTAEYLARVTKEEIREAAQRYFTDDYTLTALVPQGYEAQ